MLNRAVTSFAGPCCPCPVRGQETGITYVSSFPRCLQAWTQNPESGGLIQTHSSTCWLRAGRVTPFPQNLGLALQHKDRKLGVGKD